MLTHLLSRFKQQYILPYKISLPQIGKYSIDIWPFFGEEQRDEGPELQETAEQQKTAKQPTTSKLQETAETRKRQSSRQHQSSASNASTSASVVAQSVTKRMALRRSSRCSQREKVAWPRRRSTTESSTMTKSWLVLGGA